MVIGGFKGYERLLSLSKDPTNHRWKLLHMARSWNTRMAKLRSRDNWYKGKQEVDPPDEQSSASDGGQESSRMETVKLRIRIRSNSRLYNQMVPEGWKVIRMKVAERSNPK